jgi:SCF-associated factor 1
MFSGWSTVLLNDHGQLWAVGVLNGMTGAKRHLALVKLKFPSGWPESTSKRYEPSTAIKEFSMGRHRLLGIADDNKIWQWDDFSHPGQLVFFFTLPNDRERRSESDKRATKVVAGTIFPLGHELC